MACTSMPMLRQRFPAEPGGCFVSCARTCMRVRAGACHDRTTHACACACVSQQDNSSPLLVSYHEAFLHLMKLDLTVQKGAVRASLPPPPGFFARLLCLAPPA